MKKLLNLLKVLVIVAVSYGNTAFAKNIDITQYGAKGDGITLNTKTIQRAIDSCTKSGGGKVIVPTGTFLTGTVFLKPNVNLYLEEGAVIKGSTQIVDYQSAEKNIGLIVGYNVGRVSVSGFGIIDGNGQHQNFQTGESSPGRPMILVFVNCKDVTVKDVTLRSPASWTQKYLGCDGVLITGISVYAHANWNNDGSDIDSKNVIVSNSRFDSNDDAICLKSDRKEPCQNITITNCIVASNCNGIKLGTSGYGGFVNININGCVIRQASEDKLWQWQKRLTNITSSNTVIAGIAIECVDGGIIDQVNISNITMKDVQTPIFLRLGSRHEPTGSLQNVNISNVIATSESNMCNTISGVPGFKVKNVTIHDIMLINHAKGLLNNNIAKIPENIKGYPENRMFGNELPATGFYIRHAEDIKLKNISVQTVAGEERPFLVADDVKGLQLDDAGVKKTEDAILKSIYYLRNVSQVRITPSAFLPNYTSLIYAEGTGTQNISLYQKEKIERSKLITTSGEIKAKEVFQVYP